MANALNADILQLDGSGPLSPVQTAQVAAPAGSIGLCFSGGGSRALSCAMGQLRALHYLGVIDQVFAISSVSGGTWACSTYTWLPSTISDDDFLGLPVLDPSQLTVFGSDQFALDYLPPNNLGQVPTRLGLFRDLGEIWRLYEDWNYPINDLWQGLIGEAVLKPFGLWQPAPTNHYDPHWFTYTDAYLNQGNGPLARNPGLRASQFYTSRPGRPFIVMNTAMFTDDGVNADLMPFEANFSLGVRAAFPLNGITTVGGGFVESFAMNGSFLKDAAPGEVLVDRAPRPFTLTDIVGLSSAAFAQELEEQYPELQGLVPSYDYWPVARRKSVATTSYRFADGGSLENLGVNVMLARGMAKLLVFVNTDEPVQVIGSDIVVSSDIPPLFGLQPWAQGVGYVPYSASNEGNSATRLFRHSQVFPTSQFAALQQLLLAAKNTKGPVIARQTLNVLPNSWFGVAGNTQVEILWVHNDQVPAFWDQLSTEVQLAIDWDGSDAFPLYNTFTQLYLPAVAVNALAHLTCWNLASDWCPPHSTKSNAERVREMFN
jgi:hypothetical protein